MNPDVCLCSIIVFILICCLTYFTLQLKPIGDSKIKTTIPSASTYSIKNE